MDNRDSSGSGARGRAPTASRSPLTGSNTPVLVPGEPAPDGYYAGNLRRVVGFLLRERLALFHADEVRALRTVAELTSDALRLMARLLTRRGPVFLARTFDYSEISDCASAIAELKVAGVLTGQHEIAADRLLNCYRKAELLDLCPERLRAVAGRLRKHELIDLLCITAPDESLRRRAHQVSDYVVLGYRSLLTRVELLYFGAGGQWREPWTAFVLQDLGATRYERYTLTNERAQFPDRAALERYLTIRSLRVACRAALPEPTPLRDLLNRYAAADVVRTVEKARIDWLLGLAKNLASAGRRAESLASLRCANEHPARERSVRLLHRHKRLRARDALLATMRAYPLCSEEAQFAERFPGRHPTLPTPTTVIHLAQAANPLSGLGVEAQSAAWLTANAGTAWHLENRLPRMLFGLIYWDAVFAPVSGAFVHPFQSAPLDLRWSDFFPRRQTLLAELRHQALMADHRWLVDSWQKHVGTTNAFVHWSPTEACVLAELIRCVPMSALVSIADVMARDPGQARVGFPDLTVIYAPGCYEFVEVKGPGDSLQSGQRLWLRALAQSGLPARVLRLKNPIAASC